MSPDRDRGTGVGARRTATWVSTDAGSHLAGRSTQNTRPELILRSAVHALGLRFRLRRRIGRTTPDFVLPGPAVAVYVDGCYWHGCPTHGTREFRGPNRLLWAEKIETNRRRDERNDRALTELGWTVLRFWECEVRSDAHRCAEDVRAAARPDQRFA